MEEPLVADLIAWFDENERDLPWRHSTPWGVLVSEFMLQQTPADRVIPVWHEWMSRWPTPSDLAASSVADAIRAWGRLGYPRRAARLHASAVTITDQFDGRVPAESADLLALPGVGEYTAAAVQAFAFARRSIVLDTNVRRVLARVVDGAARQPDHPAASERVRTDLLWPAEDARSAHWSAAVMEFGAVVCKARSPQCVSCPVASQCAWMLAGRPLATQARRQPAYAGSDREARGRILAVLRSQVGPCDSSTIVDAWPDREQRERALGSLITDGLAVLLEDGRVSLPQ